VHDKSLKTDHSPSRGQEAQPSPFSVEDTKGGEDYDEGAIPTDTYNYPEFDYAHDDEDD
jgi:hypothetical protein